VKVPRLINSIIRAFDVQPLKRSAQYFAPIKYEQEGLIPDGLNGKPSDHGLADVPSPHEIGGVQMRGEIRRDFTLNLAVLRFLNGETEEESQKLRRYVLGLSLLAFTATQEPTLRQGCQLLPRGKPTWKQFFASGDERDWNPNNPSIVEFAKAAAADFGVQQPENQTLQFDKTLLKASIDGDAKKKADKKGASPHDELRKLVEKLKVNKAGTKLNDAPVRNLREFLGNIEEGHGIKPIAVQVQGVLDSGDSPSDKVASMNALVSTGEPKSQDGDAISTGPKE